MWRETTFDRLSTLDYDGESVSVFAFEGEEGRSMRACSRELAQRLLSVLAPGARVVKDAAGCPQVVGARMHMSISHSGACLVIAVGPERLGVDIEHLRYPERWKEIYEWINEPQDLPAFPDVNLFLECWTAKESLLKLIGVGLDFGMRGLYVPPINASGWRPGKAGAETYWLRPLPGYRGMVICLALERLSVVQTIRVKGFEGPGLSR